MSQTAAVADPVPIAAPPAGRLVSLDVFRGVTIAGMLLVNNPGNWGAIYPPLRHAEWHGWTPTDLIFPFFLFIVGVAMTYSTARQVELGAGRRKLFINATRRALILFALGLLIHGFPYYDLSTIRIPGVLQRIALAYWLASAVVLVTRWRGQALVAGTLLILYWLAMTLIPVPGAGAGNLEPGKDLGAYIDRMVFGTQHLWVYSKTWDPEGLLSTIPAVATTLTGVLAGYWIRSPRTPAERTAWLFVAGSGGLLLGLIWGMVFPINKNLWTSSYVLFTSGMACHFLAMCYWIVDVRGYRRWAAPFVWYGTNAIAAFFLSSIVGRLTAFPTLIRMPDPAGGDAIALKPYVYERFYAPLASPINASLLYALTYVFVFALVCWLLYRKRIFIKV